ARACADLEDGCRRRQPRDVDDLGRPARTPALVVVVPPQAPAGTEPGEAGIADVAVERLDVVSVGVEQVRGVVARRVVAKAGFAVRTESRGDACAVKGVDVRARAGVEAEVEIR